MRIFSPKEPIPLKRAEARETHRLDDWEASVNRRNEVYASALVKALDAGNSADEARFIARQAFLDTFENVAEAEFAVSLGGIEVAPMPRRGRRAA